LNPIGKIVSPGTFCTIQDLGRIGLRNFGIPRSGPLDLVSFLNANQILGNQQNSPCLEIIDSGPEIEFTGYGAFAATGSNVQLTLNDQILPPNEVCYYAIGDKLKIGRSKNELVTYVAFGGGIHSQIIFGSGSTLSRVGWGGMKGRRLLENDLLVRNEYQAINKKIYSELIQSNRNQASIRILKGPEGTDEIIEALVKNQWKKSSFSDRIGAKIKSDSILTYEIPEIKSCPVDIGTIQLPPNGEPIVLLNDGATTGGYPRVASILQVDLPIFCQKKPGQSLQFELVEIEEAQRVYGEFLHLITPQDSY